MYRIWIFGFLALISNFARSATPIVLPPNFNLGSNNASSLSAEWWKWAMSSPEESNPVRDITGEHCTVGQTGDIWFLAGGFGTSKIKRKCTIPANKYIFFPVINMVYSPEKENSGLSCEATKTGAALNNDTALDLFVELDGVALGNIKNHRAKTQECFNIFERTPKEMHPYNAFPSASDGFWIWLKPLPQGSHTIKFGGRYNRNSKDYGHMIQDIEYEITAK